MMKKFLYLTIFILSLNVVLAQEAVDINQILQTTTMPTDGEIMQVIEVLGVAQEEKQLLFDETKKKLEQMYAVGAITNATNYQALPDINKTDRNIIAEPPKLKERPKKYSKHPPLTKKH